MRVPSLVLLLGAPLAAQQTWVVDLLNRPGAHFTDLPPAVAAASTGDTMLLRGTGTPTMAYTGPTIDNKGLTILGEGAATTFVVGGVRVQNLAAPATVLISGLFLGTGTYPSGAAGVHADNCSGPIILDRITSEGPPAFLDDGFVDCQWVLVSKCDLRQYNAMIIRRSNVAIVDSRLARWALLVLFGSGSSGVYIQRSRLWVVNSYVEGTDYTSSNPANGSGPAIHTTDSEIWLSEGTLLRGGLEPAGVRTAIFDNFTPAFPPFTVAPSRVHYDMFTQFVDQYWWSIYTVREMTHLPSVHTSVANNTLTITQRSTQNGIAVLGIGPLMSPPVFGVEGMLSIVPDQAMLWWTIASGTGIVNWNFAIPPGLPQNFWIGIQGLDVSPLPQSRIRLTNPTVFGPI